MIKKIVIVGGGFSGWYLAASLRHNYSDISITVIDSERFARLGVGETLGWSGPYDWARHVGLENDRMLMWETGSIYKYGLNVNDFWHDNKNFSYGKFFNPKVNQLTKFFGGLDYRDYYEPWSVRSGDVGVQQAWMAINQTTNKTFDDYIQEVNESSYFAGSPAAPYDNDNAYVLRPQEGWSYHIDAEKCVAFLRQLSIERGAEHISSAVVDISMCKSGIDYLTLENGQKIAGDLFVDCSGLARILLKHNPTWHYAGDEYCNTACVCPARWQDPKQEMRGGTDIFGEEHGWRFRVGLYHRTGNGYVFNKNLTPSDVPMDRLLSLTDGTRLKDPKVINWTPGHYKQSWYKNILGVGMSVNFIDPYDAPTFDLQNRAIEDLFKLLKSDKDIDQVRKEFNRRQEVITDERWLRLAFNFGLSKRRGKFWDSRRQIIVDNNLMERLQDIISDGSDISSRYRFFWQQMYYRMIIATDTDRRQFSVFKLSEADRDMAESYFAYTRSRNSYIQKQKWPNYYLWLKENRFNGQSHDEVLERIG